MLSHRLQQFVALLVVCVFISVVIGCNEVVDLSLKSNEDTLISDSFLPFNNNSKNSTIWYSIYSKTNKFITASFCNNGGFSPFPIKISLFSGTCNFLHLMEVQKISCGNGEEIRNVIISENSQYFL